MMLRLLGLQAQAVKRLSSISRPQRQLGIFELSTASSSRLRLRTLSGTSKPDWMVQAELDAIKATKGRKVAGAPGDIMMDKLEHEFKAERVSNTLNQEDKLRKLIKQCKESRDNPEIFNSIRKQALQARQQLITQREASGMAKNSQLNATTVEATFPIPKAM
eukprot:m.152430 g.152430  ORF g.152430 m.152430 type:complete len:162 (-) comp30806_c1_seq1:350-835(-)